MTKRDAIPKTTLDANWSSYSSTGTKYLPVLPITLTRYGLLRLTISNWLNWKQQSYKSLKTLTKSYEWKKIIFCFKAKS